MDAIPQQRAKAPRINMKVTIEQTPDGQYAMTMGGGMDPMMGAEEPPKTFATIDEVCEAVRAAMGGSEAEAPAMMEGEQEFVDGFKKSRGMDQGY